MGNAKLSAANCSGLSDPLAGLALACPVPDAWTAGVEACAAADVPRAAAASEAMPLAALSQRSFMSARSRSRSPIWFCVPMMDSVVSSAAG